MLRKLGILISLCIFSVECFGDVIILKNDEVLRGKLISKQGKEIIFRTYDNKTIKINEDQIAVIEFFSDKVVEVQLNGKKVKGVVISETKDSIVVKTALGERTVSKFQITELKPTLTETKSSTQPPLSNITNIITNFITNTVEITNLIYITNYVFITNEENLTNKNQENSSLTFFVSSGVTYYEGKFYFSYYGGIGIVALDNFRFSITIGKLSTGFFGGNNVGILPLEWLEMRVGFGGFFSSYNTYYINTGIEMNIKSSLITLIIPVDLFFINSSTYTYLGIGIRF